MTKSTKRQSPFSPSPDWENDDALWQSFKQGDISAFEFLYQQHIQHLIQYGYKITNNQSLVQDCIQDLFVELWESRESLADAMIIKHYLLKSLRYKVMRSLQHSTDESLEEIQLLTEHENVESQLLREETAFRHSRQLAEALVQLPKRQQEAIHLRYFQELGNEEVAHVMGVNYQSACKLIYTALKTLRDKLQLSSLIPLLFSFFNIF